MVNPFFIRCVEMKEKDIIYHAIGEIDKLCQKIINKERSRKIFEKMFIKTPSSYCGRGRFTVQ